MRGYWKRQTISGGPMAQSMHSQILLRMAGRAVTDADDPPITAARAVRLAVARAANDTVGLVLTVTGMGEDIQPLDGLLDSLADELMLVGLERDGHLAGIMALDTQLRAAVLEMQTVGSVIAAPAETRPATGTDKTMCDPLLLALLDALPVAMGGSELDGWIDKCRLGNRIGSARAAGLILRDCDYRLLRLTVDLGVADRQGEVLIALPPLAQAALVEPELIDNLDWGTQFRLAVSDAPATLTAHLHRFTIPLAKARALQVGQVLPLPGCNVHSVRLISSDGHKVAQAKLGQLGGMRAVRIELAPLPQMSDLAAGGGMNAGRLALGTGDDTMAFGNDPSPMADMTDLPADLPFSMDDDPPLGLGDDFPMAPMDFDAMSVTD